MALRDSAKELAVKGSGRYVIVLLIALSPPSWNCERGLTESGDGNPFKIVFESRRGSEEYDIYVINEDGTEEQQLTFTPGWDRWPVWSPDGRKISFYSTRNGTPDIYVMDSDGRNQRLLLANTPGAAYHVWAPDGQRIAFADSGIQVINQDGTNRHRLTGSDSREPTWAPDGKRIAFTSIRDGTDEIYIMNSDGSNQQRLTIGGGQYGPLWSPDGAKMLFLSKRDHWGAELYVMNIDGTSQRRLTTNSVIDEFPSWSSDGRQITWISRPEPQLRQQVCSMNADGSNQRQLTNSLGANIHPRWSPDSRNIAFSSSRDDSLNLSQLHKIFTMNSDGTNQRALTNAPGHHGRPSWSPFPVQ